MLRKLKKKFIIINMLLAALVLNGSFLVIGITTSERLASESREALAASFVKEVPQKMPEKRNGFGMPPKRPSQLLKSLVFNVKLTKDGKSMTLIGDNVDIDHNELLEIVQLSLKQGKKTGVISEYRLRYMIRESDMGKELAFYDLANDIHTMKNLIKNFLFVELGSLIAFFIISFYLAKWALKPIQISWQQQKQFVADASHELKTPITVIMTNTDILEKHKSDTIEAQYKWLSYIKLEAEHMKKLVNDLLFLANSDATSDKPDFSKINLNDLLWNCYLPFEPVAFEQGKVLDNSIEPDIYIKGDEGKLKQLIMILLDNACKYTDKNSKIEVMLKKKQDKAYLCVTNYGTPIAPEKLSHIFERFYRADESRTRETGGYGLGLSIAKTIVDMMNGKITVTSSEEAGTTFSVIFALYK